MGLEEELGQCDSDLVGVIPIGVAVLPAVLDLLGVGEALVGFHDEDELLAVLAFVLVRVVHHDQLPIGSLDFLHRRELAHSEDLVRVEALVLRRVGQLLVGVDQHQEEHQPDHELGVDDHAHTFSA